jgi:hypothetical protein
MQFQGLVSTIVAIWLVAHSVAAPIEKFGMFTSLALFYVSLIVFTEAAAVEGDYERSCGKYEDGGKSSAVTNPC